MLARVFSRRAGWDLRPNALSQRVDARRAARLPLLDLASSNPTTCGIDAASIALRRALERAAASDAALRYAPDPAGDPRVREAIAAYHSRGGEPYSARDVVLTAGTSEGYAHLFRLLGDPGDVVHVPTPGYPLFAQLAELEGLEVRAYPLALERAAAGLRWSIDLDALAADLSSRSRAIVAIDPHNPTGSRLRAEQRASLASLAEERGLALVVDEVFADYAHADADVGRASAPDVRTFVLSGASKVLGLPQLKLAWIAARGPADARSEAVERLCVIADAFLSVSPVIASTLPELLAQRDALQAPIRARTRAARDRLRACTADDPVLEALPCEAGWNSILRVRSELPLDDEAIAIALVERAGVLVQPGYLFDLEPRDERGAACEHVVVSLLTEPDALERGVRALAALLRELAGA